MDKLSQPAPPSGLRHDLTRHFESLSRFNSSRALERSSLWKEIEDEVRRVMDTVVQEDFSDGDACERTDRVRATAWNIERGNCFEGILEVLSQHPQISASDLFFLTELDHGMARSENREVAGELARHLGLNYVFVPCYISLVKGSGLEYHVEGENTLSLHGNALFSRYPIRNAHSISLPNGKDKMRGKEKRLGYQQAAVATVEHPQGDFHAVSLHLDAHSSQRHRHRQMKLVLDHLDRLEPLPVLIGGDWNTTTFNAARAAYSIMGYARRVLMGVRNVVENHYPHPDRWFERRLFGELEERGYRYKDLNEPGGCTLHYDIDDIAVNTNMADWVPGWCFWFIEWAVQRVGGNCSLKLDWFAGRGLQPANHGHRPRVVSEVHSRKEPLSDHDPILVDVELRSGP